MADTPATGPRHLITAIEDAGFGATYVHDFEGGQTGMHNAAAAAAEVRAAVSGLLLLPRALQLRTLFCDDADLT
jgi:hypothetical protein